MAQNDSPSPVPSLQALAANLPDDVYASWLAAIRGLQRSPTSSVGRERYSFCSG